MKIIVLKLFLVFEEIVRLMPKLYLIIVFKLEFGSRAKDKVVSELTEEEKNVKALKRWHMDRPEPELV